MSFSWYSSRKNSCYFFVLVAFLSVSTIAESATVTISPTEGKRLHDDDGDSTFESAPGAMPFPQLWAVRYNNGAVVSEVQFAIEFSIPATPVGESILNATLRLDEDNDSNLTPSVDLYGYLGDGFVTVSDANTGSLLLSDFADGSEGTYTPFDVTSFVQSVSVTTDPIAGFRVEATAVTPFADMYRIEGPFSNVNVPNITAPQLVIEYGVVPEPTTILLLATILPFCESLHRRR